MKPSGIEPATFRFVAQHLNHCATAEPSIEVSSFLYYNFSVTILSKYIFISNICIQIISQNIRSKFRRALYYGEGAPQLCSAMALRGHLHYS